MTKYLTDMLAFSTETSLKPQVQQNCVHYFVEGYIGEIMYYCNKCNKDLEDVVGTEILKTHDVVNGSLIKRKQ